MTYNEQAYLKHLAAELLDIVDDLYRIGEGKKPLSVGLEARTENLMIRLRDLSKYPIDADYWMRGQSDEYKAQLKEAILSGTLPQTQNERTYGP